MKLDPKVLSLLTQNTIAAAYQAGSLIRHYKSKEVKVREKKAGSSRASQVVTEVDFLSQKIILKSLSASCELYDLALITEELPDDGSRFEKDYFWCIDPMDGTLAFLESDRGFAVSIALVSREGVPQLGVVYDPAEERLSYATAGQGFYRNRAPSSKQENNDFLTLVLPKSNSLHRDYEKSLSCLKKMARSLGYRETKILAEGGGAVMNACCVLENPPALFYKFPKPEEGGGCIWDYAATACLFAESGAFARDFSGSPLELNRVASPYMNHRGVLFSSSSELGEKAVEVLRGL